MSISANLSGKTALVTGASSDGFGSHFAHVLAAAGAEVIVTARSADALEAVAGEIREKGGKARAVVMDVADVASVKAALEEVGVVDVVVNNAGVAKTAVVLDQTDEDFDQLMAVNLKGVWTVARETARAMIAAGREGNIINIASVCGLRTVKGATPYAVSKAGVIHLTKQLALEWARYGIRVNALAPGYFETRLNRDFFASEAGTAMRLRVPQRRFGEFEHLDGPLLLLASDASDYMTGSVITVDGGHVLSAL